MGIFKKAAESKVLDKLGKAAGSALRAGAETFTNPLYRAALTPFVSVASPNKPVQTPFGEVKSLKQSTPGESLGMAAEIILSGPSGTATKALKPVTKVGSKVLGKLAKPVGELAEGAIRSSATQDIYQALNPTKEATKKLTEKIAPEVAKRKLVGTRKQLINFAQEGLDEVGEEFNKLGEMKGTVSLKNVDKKLKSLAEKAMVDGKIVDKGLYRAVQEVDSIFRQFGETIYNESGAAAGQAFPVKMDAEKLRTIRRIFDKEVAESAGHLKDLKDASILNIKKQAANTVRNILSKANPDFAKLNEEFTFYSRLADVLEATKTRKVGQSGLLTKGFGAGMGALLGSISGPIGAAAGAGAGAKGAQFFASPLFKTMSAATKTKFADALVSGEHSLPKIIDFITQRKAFGALKTKDFVEFLNSEASRLDEKEKAEAERAQEERVKMIRERIYGNEQEEEDQEVQQEESITNESMDEATREELPEPTPEIQMIIDRLSS